MKNVSQSKEFLDLSKEFPQKKIIMGYFAILFIVISFILVCFKIQVTQTIPTSMLLKYISTNEDQIQGVLFIPEEQKEKIKLHQQVKIVTENFFDIEGSIQKINFDSSNDSTTAIVLFPSTSLIHKNGNSIDSIWVDAEISITKQHILSHIINSFLKKRL